MLRPNVGHCFELIIVGKIRKKHFLKRILHLVKSRMVLFSLTWVNSGSTTDVQCTVKWQSIFQEQRVEFILLYNVFCPTRNALTLNMHRNDKEHKNTWMDSKIYTWKKKKSIRLMALINSLWWNTSVENTWMMPSRLLQCYDFTNAPIYKMVGEWWEAVKTMAHLSCRPPKHEATFRVKGTVYSGK